jgi:hypothetical protein
MRHLVVGRRIPSGWSVAVLDRETGRLQPVREVEARETSGLRSTILASTPDAKYLVHSYSRLLVDLYLAEGLK